MKQEVAHRTATEAGTSVRRLRREVIAPGLCTGCGTCVAVCPADCLTIDDVEPRYTGGCTSCAACVDGCPGLELPMGALEQNAFGRQRDPEDELGVYRRLLAGYAADADTRARGTSGGAVTALLRFLLDRGEITGAVVSGFDPRRPWRAKPVIARTVQQLSEAAGSKYVMCPQNAVLAEARPDDRLAVVGLPCQIEGLRKSVGSSAADYVTLTVGLFCLANFLPEATVYMVEEVFGISLDEVSALAYREGPFPGSFTVVTRGGERRSLAYPEAKQHLRMFRPYRCTVCYDWSAELADLSAGDLWSDPDREAYSTVIVRSDAGEAVVGAAETAGVLDLEPVEYELVVDNPGFRYKKRGNRVIIREARRHGLPCPTYPQSEKNRPVESIEKGR